MRYEAFLFTRNQRQDFSAFIRPSKLTNKDVSAIGAMFNYMSDISRLTPRFPGLYCFRLGAYTLLLRHYGSERTHAGRTIAVIEGIALQQVDGGELAQCISEQDTVLNIIGTIKDIDEQRPQVATEQEWYGLPMHHTEGAFVQALLARRSEDRLFLPFNGSGLDMLLMALADQRFPSPPSFAFGTNSDVLTQLERRGASIDIVSFLNTDSPSFRSRATNRFSSTIDGYEAAEPPPDPSMSVRPTPPGETRALPPSSSPYQLPSGSDNRPAEPPDPSMSLRSTPRRETGSLARSATSPPDDQPTSSESESFSLRGRINRTQTSELNQLSDADAPRLMTLREMRDKIRAEEQAAKAAQPPDEQPSDPLHRLLKLLASFISPPKPK